MFKDLFKKKITGLQTAMDGEIIKMEEVPDEVFATKMMGDGYAVKPTGDGSIYSPCDGEVVNVFKTSHAYIIRSVDGLEIIVHIGLDSVKLKGEGFDVKVKEGDNVKAGQLISKVDLALLEKEGISTISPIVITNMDKVKSIKAKLGTVNCGDISLTYELK